MLLMQWTALGPIVYCWPGDIIENLSLFEFPKFAVVVNITFILV